MPDPSHSFLNDHDGAGDDIPAVFAWMTRLARMGYHERSALDARRRIVGFFDTHLKG